MDKQPTRVCSKCRRDLPLDCFYKSNRGTKKLDYWCKECKEEQRRERLLRTPPPPKPPKAEVNTKTCTKCGQELPLTSFGRHSTCKGGYNSVCKECDAAYHRQLYLAKKATKETKAPVTSHQPICLRLDAYLMGVQPKNTTPQEYATALRDQEHEARRGNCQFSHRCPDRKQCPVAVQTLPPYQASNPKNSSHDPNYKRRQPLED